MRTLTAAQAAVLAGTARAEHVRVDVKDAGAVWRDLSIYPGFDAVDSVAIDEDIDDPFRMAHITLKREVDGLSLAPFMEESAINVGFVPGGSYSPLLDLWREVRVYAAVTAVDAAVDPSSDWMLVFEGRIETLNPAAGETVTLECRDKHGEFMRTWMEEQRVYALAEVAGSVVGLRVWIPNMELVLNEYVIPSEARKSISGSPRFYKVTTAGTGAATEPLWPVSGTVGSGSAVFTFQGTTSPTTSYPIEDCMQLIMTAWLLSLPTLNVPTPPSYNLLPWIQNRGPVLDTMRSLAMQLGWDFRSKWDATEYKPTFYEPQRSKTTPDYTFSADDIEDYKRMQTEIVAIGNAGRVIFPNSLDLGPEGQPLPGEVEAVDAPSIASYGRSFFEIGEDQLSAVDTPTKATYLLTAALADVGSPKVDVEIPLMHGFPWVELGDLYRFTPNGRHFSTNQDWAVAKHSTEWKDGAARTSLSLRGKPAAGHRAWHDMMVRNLPDQLHDRVVYETNIGITLADATVVGGTMLSFPGAPNKLAHGVEYEVHISETPAFTPSAATLRDVVKTTSVTLADLIPAKTYYAQIVPRIRNGQKLRRAQPSLEHPFVAGRGGAGHLKQEVEWGRLPLNGGFETWNDTGDVADHWEIGGAGWLSVFSRGNSSASKGGNQFVICALDGVNPDKMQTRERITVDAGETYRVEWWVKIATAGTAGSINLQMLWSEWDFFSAGSTVVDTVNWNQAGMTPGVWYKRYADVVAPATAKFAIVRLEASATGNAVFHVDSARVEPAIVQPPWIALPFTAGWANFGSGLETGGYMKDTLGFVHLKGTVLRTSGVSTIITTLPAGYRPLSNIKLFVVMCNNLAGRVDIATTGTATLVIGVPTSFVSLDGVLFLP